jgi:Membrane-associating domain
MPRILGVGLRAAEFVITVILLGLVGSLEATSSHNPESVHYSMFTAAFSILFLFYLIPATWSDSFSFHPFLPIVLDALNVIFTFCAAVTLAARTKGDSCSNHVSLPPAFS